MNKVLIITYYWPPSGGAGVQRWLKFTKYLPAYGWEPVVLTVDPDYAAYPAFDHSLSEDIPGSVKVVKTRATDWFRVYGKSKVPSAGFAKNNDRKFTARLSRFIRGNFFIPDPRRGWNRHAIKKASELIEREGIKYIITTSPPHSTQLIGRNLKKKYPGLKWVADLRDPWTDIYYYRNFYPTIIPLIIDKHYEKSVLCDADLIITVGNSLMEMFSLKHEGVREKSRVIFNGYDPDDFKGIEKIKPETFTISYTGTLSPVYPLKSFLTVVAELKERGKTIRLRFTGEVPAEIKNEINASSGAENTEFNNYTDHISAIGKMMNSSALLLIIPDHESNTSIITGKIFEYLATGLPIICIGPVDGDASAIIAGYGNGMTFGYDDKEGILKFIESVISGEFKCSDKPHIDIRRDCQAKLLASLLENTSKGN